MIQMTTDITDTTETERPTPLQHTFTVTVEVDPRWVDYVTQHGDIFGRTYYAGYWARGVDHDPKMGWLVWESDDQHRRDEEPDLADAHLAWREGRPLPEHWYRLDRAAALRMWEEGVKRFGVGWYDSSAHDGAMEDVLLQLALLGEERYG